MLKKRIVGLMIILAGIMLVFAFTGCGGDDGGDSFNPGNPSNPGGGPGVPSNPGGDGSIFDPIGAWEFNIWGKSGFVESGFFIVLGSNYIFSGAGYSDSGTFTRNGNTATLRTSTPGWNNAIMGTATLTSNTTMTLSLVTPSLITGSFNGVKLKTPSDSITLNPNQWKNGILTNQNKGDWYSFNVTAGQTYYIWGNSACCGDGTKTGDVSFIALYDDGIYIFDEYCVWGEPEYFLASRSGRVYIIVRSEWDGFGSYSIVYSTDGQFHYTQGGCGGSWGEAVPGPGPNPDTGNGTFTLTNIPSEHNGKYAWTNAANNEISLIGIQSYNFTTDTFTFSLISNGQVSIPMWVPKYVENTERYSGNDTLWVELHIFQNGNFFSVGDIIVQFDAVTFSNGSATKSWNDADEIWWD
jgi:hypothetical protein